MHTYLTPLTYIFITRLNSIETSLLKGSVGHSEAFQHRLWYQRLSQILYGLRLNL